MNTYKQEFHQRIYKYGLNIIKLVEKLSKDNTSQVLGKQLLRSGTSVVANIMEAKSASSKKDYLNFYQYSLKSANESKLWICYLRDAHKISDSESDVLLKETSEIANILAASVITMKNKRKI